MGPLGIDTMRGCGGDVASLCSRGIDRLVQVAWVSRELRIELQEWDSLSETDFRCMAHV